MEKAKLISESRILTDSDFKRIRAHQIRQQIAAGRKIEQISGRKRTNDDVLLEEEVQEKIARFVKLIFIKIVLDVRLEMDCRA